MAGRLPDRRPRSSSRWRPSGLRAAFVSVVLVFAPLSVQPVFHSALSRPEALVQASCEAATDSATKGPAVHVDAGSNWGSVPEEAVGAECADVDEKVFDEGLNWGTVPRDQAVIQIQLPEVFGQAAGEMGIPLGAEPAPAGDGNCAGAPAALDPSWDDVNRWHDAIEAVSQQVFEEVGVLVPANVIKAVMKIESGGDPMAAPAYGLMQVTADTIGSYDLPRTQTDPTYGIYAGAKELALRYLDSGKLPWENVVVGYFSGHYVPTGAADQFSTDLQYQDRFKEFFAQVEAVLPEGRPCSNASVAGVASIWGNILFNGAPPPLTQDYGPTDFSRFVRPEWYMYALEYGFTEPGHTGLDVGTPAGTPLYAPMDATVVCAGTGNGTGEDSCGYFLSAYGGPTSGRFQLKLPNGDMLILGHVNQSIVSPGEQVKAGQQVAVSGGFNGDHVHIEYRTRDPGTKSGWRLVDPRVPLDGVSVRPLGSPVSIAPPAVVTQPTPTATPTPAPDADQDGLSDAEEASYGADPNNFDSDGDGLSDGAEVYTYRTLPANWDTDGDGLSDDEEVSHVGSSPLSADTDADGLPDYNEVYQHGTSPSNPDTDGDGFTDHDEANAGSNPNDAGSLPDSSANVDSDFDNLSDGDEQSYGVDPLKQDTDGDRVLDGDEVHTFMTNPAFADSDNDGLTDGQEIYSYFTNPLQFDSDGDGWGDGDEVTVYGTNPFDVASHP